jgi:hypothetical protein
MRTQEEKHGIKETEDVFDLAVSIKEAIQLSKADDGKVDLRKDFTNFIRPVTILPRAFEGARNIPQEWGDLSEAEIIRLRDRYGEIVDDERWQRAFMGLVIAGDAIYEIASEERAA